MYNSLEISNFKGFESICLEGLGRVNLIVGRNNTGKTSLLEAITVLSDPDVFSTLPGLFRANPGSGSENYYRWLVRDGAMEQDARLQAHHSEGNWTILIQLNRDGRQVQNQEKVLRGYEFVGGKLSVLRQIPKLKVRAVSVQHRSPDSLVEAFAEAVRPAEGEAQMESLLRAVDSRVKTVRMDYAKGAQPFIVVDLGLSERVPLSQAGQGIYRLVAIFSELLGQRPQVCFIDEIENGIHYTVLPQVWKGIAEVAERLNVQVFATTHSGECLAAAHEAFSARSDYDFRVIQLYRVEDRVDGRVLNRKLIEAGLEGNIDIR